MILVIGATGNIGSELVRQLLAADHPVRAGVRSIDRARKRLGAGPEYVAFDFEDAAHFPKALDGATALFFIAPQAEPLPAVRALLKAAAAAKVQHLTFSSGRTTGDLANRPLHAVENLVRESGLNWTILRPGWFMQNFTGWIGSTIPVEGKFYLPAGRARTAFIDLRDIAAVAARSLTGTGHAGQTYELTSLAAYDHYQVAEMIGAAAGRPVTYVDLAPEEYVRWAAANGWTEAAARFNVFLYEQVKTGKEEAASPDAARVLGRDPRSLPAFIIENAPFWRKR